MSFTFILLVSAFCVLVVITSLFMLISFSLHERNEKKARKWQQLEHRWEHLTESVLNKEIAPEKLWDNVDADEKLFFLDYLYHKAEHMPWRLEHSPRYQQLMRLAEPYMPAMVHRLDYQEEELRSRAVDTFGKLSPYQYRDALRAALEDPSDAVAFAAFRALVYSYDVGDAGLLIKTYPRFYAFQPAYLAILLSHLPPETTMIPIMTHALQTQNSDWCRMVALLTLERWSPQIEHAGALAALALSDQESEVIKGLILRVLLRWNAKNVLSEVVLDFAAQDSDYLRAYAMFALGESPSPQGRELLELGLTDPSRWVAIEAAQSLAYLEDHGDRQITRQRRVSGSLLTYSQHQTRDEVFV